MKDATPFSIAVPALCRVGSAASARARPDRFCAISSSCPWAKRRITLELVGAPDSRFSTPCKLLLPEAWPTDGKDALRYRFDRAREKAGIPKDAFQFRDLRAKAGTDRADASTNIRQAQHLLGHKSVTTTEIYVRKRKGALTNPTR